MNLKIIQQQIIDFLIQLHPFIKEQFEKKKNISIKKDNSIVTETDIFVEKNLVQFLQSLIKNSYFLGEETAPKSFKQAFKNDYLWVVDPIDGTNNFANGKKLYAVSIALMKKYSKGHKSILGIIMFPSMDKLYFHYLDDVFEMNLKNNFLTKVTLKKRTNIIFNESDFFHTYAKFDYKNVKKRKLGCTVADFMYVFTKKSDCATTFAHIWDVAASIFLAEKLGIGFYNIRTGKNKVYFTDKDFILRNNDYWLLKDAHIITSLENLSFFKNKLDFLN